MYLFAVSTVRFKIEPNKLLNMVEWIVTERNLHSITMHWFVRGNCTMNWMVRKTIGAHHLCLWPLCNDSIALDNLEFRFVALSEASPMEKIGNLFKLVLISDYTENRSKYFYFSMVKKNRKTLTVRFLFTKPSIVSFRRPHEFFHGILCG